MRHTLESTRSAFLRRHWPLRLSCHGHIHLRRAKDTGSLTFTDLQGRHACMQMRDTPCSLQGLAEALLPCWERHESGQASHLLHPV